MKSRSLVAIVMVVLAAGATSRATAGQEPMPRTPWGHPDLQGTYTNKTITPLERPAELAGRELLTAEEAADLEREAAARNAELLARPARRTAVTENVNVGEDGAPGYYNSFWLDAGVTSTGRTSIIVDPPDGRLPPLTPAGQRDRQNFWFGADLDPDGNQVWFRIALEAVRRMKGQTPGARGERLVNALLAWLTPGRQLERDINRFEVRVSDDGDTWVERLRW